MQINSFFGQVHVCAVHNPEGLGFAEKYTVVNRCGTISTQKWVNLVSGRIIDKFEKLWY